MNTWEKAIRICYQTGSPQQPGIINFRTAQGWDSGRERFPSSFSLYCSGVSQQVFTSRDNSADTNMRLQQRILQRPRVHSWPHRLVDLCAQAGTEFKGYDAWFNFVFSLLWNLSLFMNKTSCIFILLDSVNYTVCFGTGTQWPWDVGFWGQTWRQLALSVEVVVKRWVKRIWNGA